jgi:hypothetical protein
MYCIYILLNNLTYKMYIVYILTTDITMDSDSDKRQTRPLVKEALHVDKTESVKQ